MSLVRARPGTILAMFCGAGAVLAAAPLFADAAAPAAPAAHPFAAPQAVAPAGPAALSGLGQVTFALLIVLAAVFVVAWLVRRVRAFNNRVGNAVDVLADIPLGQKERAVLLKVGQTQILLGVAPGQVNALHVLAEPLELVKPATGPLDGRSSFKALMMRSLGK